MKILETLNFAYPWKWDEQEEDDYYSASFAGDKHPYEVTFTCFDHDNKARHWSVEFVAADQQFPDAFSILNDGENTMRVLSTVVSIVRQFAQQHPHCTISFNSDEPTRSNVYRRIVSRVSKNAQVHAHDGYTLFVIQT